jgi:hypothetical protein
MRNYKTVLYWILTGIFLVVVSGFLTLAIDQAILLTRLYDVSAFPGPVTDYSQLRGLSFGSELSILAILAAILFVPVRGRPRRLLPVSIVAILIFVALNLYSGRHVLPRVLVWPSPVPLSERYVQALAENDLEAALRLTDRSPECEALMGEVLQDDQARVKQILGDDGDKLNIRDASVMRFTTFYDKPFPQGLGILQPVPQQLVTVMVETEKGSPIWLSLKMSYGPFIGTRYICGGEIG